MPTTKEYDAMTDQQITTLKWSVPRSYSKDFTREQKDIFNAVKRREKKLGYVLKKPAGVKTKKVAKKEEYVPRPDSELKTKVKKIITRNMEVQTGESLARRGAKASESPDVSVSKILKAEKDYKNTNANIIQNAFRNKKAINEVAKRYTEKQAGIIAGALRLAVAKRKVLDAVAEKVNVSAPRTIQNAFRGHLARRNVAVRSNLKRITAMK